MFGFQVEGCLAVLVFLGLFNKFKGGRKVGLTFSRLPGFRFPVVSIYICFAGGLSTTEQ